MPASAPADTHPARPTETPKDLKKRVRGLDKSLTNVHERLVQTEKQIFDLERSYLEETRLYGNVLQGWDAYLDIKGKGTGDNILRGGKRGSKRAAPADDAEDGEDEIGEAYWACGLQALTYAHITDLLQARSTHAHRELHTTSCTPQQLQYELPFVVTCCSRVIEWKPRHDTVVIVQRASAIFAHR